jgi:hypothetical protein
MDLDREGLVGGWGRHTSKVRVGRVRGSRNKQSRMTEGLIVGHGCSVGIIVNKEVMKNNDKE